MANPQFLNNSIFWVEVDKIAPNPYQPRREFDEGALRDLADSIRMYGVLQPLVVTRKEVVREDGGLAVLYELISGERRLRASKIAGLSRVPVLIRSAEEGDREKLELAIIENLQREDLNSVERARAFKRLVEDFKFKHSEIAKRVSKSREYVSNTLRILLLPEDILKALAEGKISEGHTRPILMLIDRPEEQKALFQEILVRRINVREAEQMARRVAIDRVRKRDPLVDPELHAMEEKLKETLGTRVHIERKEVGGKITIDFFTLDDLRGIFERIGATHLAPGGEGVLSPQAEAPSIPVVGSVTIIEEDKGSNDTGEAGQGGGDDDLYMLKNFSV